MLSREVVAKPTSCSSGAYSAVAGVVGVAADVTDSGVQDGILGEMVAVHVLDTPEAASCDCGLLGTLGYGNSASSLRSEAHG